MIRVILPTHLRNLAQIDSREVALALDGPPTVRSVIDALEARYPMLRGTIRDIHTHRRRDFIRFFGGGADLSHNDIDAALPEAIAAGREPLRIVGAMAGG